MPDEKINKIITIILVIAISAAALVFLYVNLPQQYETNDNSDDVITDDTIFLTVTYADVEKEYTLNDLEGFNSVTGSGSYIKTKLLPDSVVIKGPFTYTGVDIISVLNDFNDLPSSYNVTVIASDGWETEYTQNDVKGNVNNYNETGNITGNNNIQMIIAYKEDDEYITDEEVGPLRIAFIGENTITESNLWSKMVTSITITEL